jgi:hypothetical protein
MPLPTAAILAGHLVLAPAVFDNALTGIHADGPKRLEVSYEGITPVPVLGRIKVAAATVEADISGASYAIRARAKSAGMADWFTDYNLFMTSTGRVTPGGLKPARYVSSNQDGARNRLVTVDFSDAEVSTTAIPKFGDLGFPPATPEQKLEARDPLAAIVQLALHVEATPDNPCGGPIRVFDGKQRYDLVLTFNGRINWQSKVYTGPALNCAITYVEHAGFKEKSEKRKAKDKADMRWANIILAELEGGAVTPPIKIEGRSKKRGKMTAEATRLSWGPSPEGLATGR